MIHDDPAEEKPDTESLELQFTGSNGSDQFSNEADEDSLLQQPKRIKMEEDEEDMRTSNDSANGHHDHTQPTTGKNGEIQENETSDDFNPKIVSVETTEGTSTSPSSSQPGIRINELEKEVNSLECLLVTKELEWNAILRLKKLKELLLEQFRREDEIANVIFPSDDADVKTLVKECLLDQDNIGRIVAEAKSFTCNIRSETAKVELEITENSGRRYRKIVSNKEEPSLFDTRVASKALQQLSERNSGAVKSKQGRNGPIVPVTSLIADYRAKRKQESPVSRKRSRVAKPSSTQSPSTSISYSDVLISLAKISKIEKESASPDVSCNSTPSSTPKGSTRTPNASSTNKSNITLAKLLGSSGGSGTGGQRESGGSLRLEDNKSTGDDYKGRHANSSINPETNISLSNLLASNSKARSEQGQPKTESIPICQGCNTNQAQFVCAGCGNQWYCSRECQVDAWDDHAESCSG